MQLLMIVYVISDLLFLFQLPQQENSYDCGLFLLHYLELFLAEAPQNFSPFKIYNASNFVSLCSNCYFSCIGSKESEHIVSKWS